MQQQQQQQHTTAAAASRPTEIARFSFSLSLFPSILREAACASQTRVLACGRPRADPMLRVAAFYITFSLLSLPPSRAALRQRRMRLTRGLTIDADDAADFSYFIRYSVRITHIRYFRTGYSVANYYRARVSINEVIQPATIRQVDSLYICMDIP